MSKFRKNSAFDVRDLIHVCNWPSELFDFKMAALH